MRHCKLNSIFRNEILSHVRVSMGDTKFMDFVGEQPDDSYDEDDNPIPEGECYCASRLIDPVRASIETVVYPIYSPLREKMNSGILPDNFDKVYDS